MEALRLWSILFLSTLGATAYAAEAPEMTGAELYRSFCAACHGIDARGNGPRAKSMQIKAPDLTLIARRNGGTFPSAKVRRIVDGRALRPAHFSNDMPIWGAEFYAYKGEDVERRKRADELISKLVAYLRPIQQK